MWMDNLEQVRDHLLHKLEDISRASLDIAALDFSTSFSLCVSGEENLFLCQIPGIEEVFNVFKSMHPIKAPSLDEMHAVFYQRYWDIVGGDLVSLV